MQQGMLIHNARIWTATGRWADSLLIRDGRVAALDGDARFASVSHIIDAAGRTVVPGFIDSHVHLLMAGRSLRQLDLSSVRSRDEFKAAIASRHAQLEDGQWLIAHGWSSENWGGEVPDKSWLAAAEDRPVVAYRVDIHVALVNDAVLKLCNLTTDPPGGRIERDATGDPTGLMVESAAWKIVNPLVPDPNAHEKSQHLMAAQSHAHARGITAVGTMEYSRDLCEVFTPSRDLLTLRCRVTLLDRHWPMEFNVGRDFPASQNLAVIGYKAFIDGTLGSRTARMLADYADDPGNRGMLVELAAEGHLQAWAHAVAAAGLSPSMHAIGDEACRRAMDAIAGIDPSVRPRIEHAQQIDNADFRRFSNTIASMQPLHRADDGRFAESRVGSARTPGSFAFRRLLDAGAVLAFGSDWPVVSCDSIAGMRAAITGLTLEGKLFQPQENLTVEEALHAYTTGAAYALQIDDAGKIAIGSLGDAVMLDRDPFTADWVNAPPRVEMTIVNGEVVYDSHSNGYAHESPHR